MPNGDPVISPAIPNSLTQRPQWTAQPVSQVVAAPAPVTPSTQASSVTVNVTPPSQNQIPAVPIALPPAQPTNQPIKIELNISTTPVAPTIPATSSATPTPALLKAQEGVVVHSPTSPATPAAAPSTPQKPDSLIKRVLHWGVFIALSSLGVKGFFDSLYFILVEFQYFEKGLENNYIETKLVSQLILKAALLIFGTALCIFFALQLSLLNKRGNKWLTIWSSIAVFIASFFVLHYANSIHVVDVFK